MSRLDKELEAAYAATREKQKQLERSKDELREISAHGKELGRSSKTALLVSALAGAAIGSGILLYDPESRIWGFFLLAVLAVAAVWSYYRHWRR